MTRRSKGPTGATTHVWNVSAINSQSFVAALSDHASPLAKIVRDTFNSNVSLRPLY
jgi:hypothetical protein